MPPGWRRRTTPTKPFGPVGAAFSTAMYALNVTSWGPYIPGWSPPHAEQALEVLLAGSMFSYPGMILWFWGQRWLAGPVLRRGWGTLRLLPVLIAIGMVVDLVLELVFVPLFSFYSFSKANWQLSLFGGHWYQLPLTTLLLDGAMATAMTFMACQATRKGCEVHLFRGSDRFGPKAQPWLRLLAGTGYITVVWGIYLVLVNLLPLLMPVGPTPPDTPDYLRFS